MIYLRSTIFLAGQVLFTLVFFPLSLISIGMPPLRRSRFIAIWARFVIWWLRQTCNLTFRVEYEAPLPESAGIFLSKHQSAWETIAFQCILPPHAWVLKRELLWIPVFGWGLALTRPVAIDRDSGRKSLEQVVEQGRKKLAEGRWVLVFPEGTRMPPGEHGRFNVGAGLLAQKTSADVVPIAHNAGSCWPKRGFLKKSGSISVVIGKSISTDGKNARQINQQAEAWIQKTMHRIENDLNKNSG